MRDEIAVYTPALGREVVVRPGTEDLQVWADTFTGLYHVHPAIPPPRTVLDLGANIGLTAAHYQVLWPDAEIVAVEMDAANAELARRNAPEATIRCEAVSSWEGAAFYDPNVPTDAFTLAAEPGERQTMRRRLRQIIRRSFASQHADFVKMDVEGAEWSLFAYPDWVPLVDRLLVELHGSSRSESLLARGLEELERIGFAAARHTPHPQAIFAVRR